MTGGHFLTPALPVRPRQLRPRRKRAHPLAQAAGRPLDSGLGNTESRMGNGNGRLLTPTLPHRKVRGRDVFVLLGEGRPQDQKHSSDDNDCCSHPARTDVKESARNKRRDGNARDEYESQLDQVSGSGRLIPRSTEALCLEQCREHAAHCEQGSQTVRRCHDQVPQRTHFRGRPGVKSTLTCARRAVSQHRGVERRLRQRDSRRTNASTHAKLAATIEPAATC